RGLLLPDVVDAQQIGDLDGHADLLDALAKRGIGGVLVVVDETAGQAPEPIARIDPAPPEPDPFARLDNDDGHDLRVTPEHEVVGGAGLHNSALDLAWLQRPAAVDAVVGHVAHGRGGFSGA